MSRWASASVTAKPCDAASCAMPRPIWPAPTTPMRVMPSRGPRMGADMVAVKCSSDRGGAWLRRELDGFDRERDAFAAADAQRRDAAALARVAQRRQQRD